VHDDGHRVMVDGYINSPANALLDATGCTTTACEQVDDELAAKVEANLVH
jgi:hypothetical protein